MTDMYFKYFPPTALGMMIVTLFVMAWIFHPMHEEIDESGYKALRSSLEQCPQLVEELEVMIEDTKISKAELSELQSKCRVLQRDDSKQQLLDVIQGNEWKRGNGL
jgi:hypothetical protein